LDELMEAARAVGALDPGKRTEIVETIRMLTGNLEKIVERGRRADGIVRSMLQHSRGSSEERQPTDLNALAEEALNLAYHGARAQDPNFDIALEHDLDSNLAPVDVVPKEPTRVFERDGASAAAGGRPHRAAHCRRRKPGEQSAHAPGGAPQDQNRGRRRRAQALNHLGLKRRKGPPIRSRGLDKTEPQRRASRPLEKWKGFD
jgi:hypothetical protein